MKDVWVILQIICLLPVFSLAAVTINNNGYRGVEVVIHEDVPEDLNLLTTIKEMLKSSSAWLYNTTNKRAYFEEITIVLPSTWSSKPEYKKVPEDDYYTAASLRIGPPHPSYNHTPYTFQPGGCGEFGRFIHITPDYIRNYQDLTAGRSQRNNATKHAGLAKIFIHEWYHLRYGVFNEFGTNDPRFPPFYKDGNNMVRPNVCPATVQGYRRRRNQKPCIVDKRGRLIGDCNFFPTTTGSASSSASMMYMPLLPYAKGPCEDDDSNHRLHNAFAPNEHNLKCAERSVRNVTESGPDFRNGRNPPRDIPQTEPKISILHLENNTFPGYVLVLDVSSSMSGRPWEQLKEATSRALKYKAKPSCPVGMVSFSDTSRVLAQLTPINDNTRNQLLAKIPAGVGGYTAIGQGLLAALGVLGAGNKPVEKGKIILITDGEENRPPNIVDVTQQLQSANVIVYGLAFGAQASKKIEDLSRVTGGKGWFFNSAHLTQSLDSMLDEIFQNCGPVNGRPIINKNGAFKLLVGDEKTGIFQVESGAIKTSIFISYEFPDRRTNDGAVPLFTVTSPSGRVYNAQSPEYIVDRTLKTVMFGIRSAEPGRWTYYFKNQENNNIIINLMITSEKGNTNDDPIRVNSWISEVNLTYPNVPKVYAEVKKNLNPVLNATVVANIFKPNGETIKIPLQDNGRGADANANDGVYSEFYTYFNGDGRYAIDITVDSNNGQAGIATNLPPNFGAPEYLFLNPDEASEKPMSEFPLSTFDVVDEEFDTSAIYDPVLAQKVPDVVLDKIEDFDRFATAGTFILSKWVAKDLIPPGRIDDLNVKNYEISNRTVTLEWTSVGDDMFTGQASSIEVGYHPDLTRLMKSFESTTNNFTILRGSLKPSEPYRLQTLYIQLPPEDKFPLTNTSTGDIYFAVRTLDEEKNKGHLSNPVVVSFKVAPAPVLIPKDRCEKYVQVLLHNRSPHKEKGPTSIKKKPSEVSFHYAKYRSYGPRNELNEVELRNIPKHCWPVVQQAFDRLAHGSYPSMNGQEHGMESLNVYSKTAWRKWWRSNPTL